MLSLFLNSYIFALLIAILFFMIHYYYLKFNNQEDELTRNEYIMIFINYYIISIATLMGYKFLNDYLNSNENSSEPKKNVMFGGSNVVNSNSNSNGHSASISTSLPSGPSVASFKPVSKVEQVSRPDVAKPNYESFRTGRPTF